MLSLSRISFFSDLLSCCGDAKLSLQPLVELKNPLDLMLLLPVHIWVHLGAPQNVQPKYLLSKGFSWVWMGSVGWQIPHWLKLEVRSQVESFVPNSSHLKADLELCNVVGCVNGAAIGAHANRD